MKFGEKLKILRQNNNLSQQELASLTELSVRTIQNYEISDMLPKKRETYDRLASALGVQVSQLMDENVEFQLDARRKYGSRGERQARILLEKVQALYAGGDLAPEDIDAFNRALQEAYWEAKAINQKFTPKKYRKGSK